MIKTLLLLSSILIFSCAHQRANNTQNNTAFRDFRESTLVYRSPASFWDIFKAPRIDLQQLTEEDDRKLEQLFFHSLIWREKAHNYYNILIKYQNKQPLNDNEKQLLVLYAQKAYKSNKELKSNEGRRPLSSFLIKNLHRTFSEYKTIFTAIEDIVKQHDWFLRRNYKFIISTKMPTGEDKEAWHRYQMEKITGLHSADDDEFVQPFIINPHDINGIIMIEKVKYLLAAALLFYDNYLYAIRYYQDNLQLRKLINYDREENHYFLQNVSEYFHSFTYFSRLNTTINLFNEINKFETKTSPRYLPSSIEAFSNKIVINSYMYQIFRKINSATLLKNKFNFYLETITMVNSHALDQTTNTLSKAFGNVVGQFQSRHGKLLSLSKQEQKAITKQLKPLDILLEKTPFRLTDKFIPGHFGHAAIWIGTEKDLKQLGIWDHPLVTPYHYFIRRGHSIVEALRPGVQINTFQHFLDIDDLAILRSTEKFDRQTTIRYLLNAFAQIGKDYDFNFDVETDAKIVCSELIYVTFDDMDWITEKAMGRYTISPDNVATKVMQENSFYPILIYHDGKELASPLEKQMYNLLQKRYEKLKYK